MFRSRFLLTAVVAVAAALLAPATSQATFTLTLQTGSGFGPTTFTDGVSEQGPAVADGSLVYVGTYGGVFNVSVTSASSNSTPPTSPAVLGFTQVILTNTSGVTQTLTLTLEDNAFSAPTQPNKFLQTRLSADVLGNPAGGNNSSVSIQNSLNGVNATPLTITAAGTPVPLNQNYTVAGTYTLKSVVTITLAAGETFNGSGSAWVMPTPAPTGLVMLAGALPFAGLLRLRRRQAKAEPTAAA